MGRPVRWRIQDVTAGVRIGDETLVLGRGRGVDEQEVGAVLVGQPVADHVERALIDDTPRTRELRRVAGRTSRGPAVDDDVRPAHLDVGSHRLQRVVDLVVERGVGGGVPPVGGRVVEALELVPDLEAVHVRVAERDLPGQLCEVAVVLGQGRDLELAPVGCPGCAALHPVRRTGERDRHRGAGRSHEADPGVERPPLVDAGRRLGVRRSPAHDVLVLTHRHGRQERAG